MSNNRELTLNILLKVSIIALAVAGAYFFIASVKSKKMELSQSIQKGQLLDEFVMKQKCHDEAVKYVNEKNTTALKGESYSLNINSFNRSLNTCFVDYEHFVPTIRTTLQGDTLFNDSEQVDDVLAGNKVAAWNRNDNTGYSKNDPKCCKTRDEFKLQRAQYMGNLDFGSDPDWISTTPNNRYEIVK